MTHRVPILALGLLTTAAHAALLAPFLTTAAQAASPASPASGPTQVQVLTLPLPTSLIGR